MVHQRWYFASRQLSPMPVSTSSGTFNCSTFSMASFTSAAARSASARGFAERIAVNTPMQGGAADLIKKAMIRIDEELERGGWQTRLLLQVHDELLFEVPVKEADKTAALVKSVMEGAADPVVQLDVPLVADVGMADNWADAH